MNTNIYNIEPFSIAGEKKRKFFEKQINLLTSHHYKHSKGYRKILDSFGYKFKNTNLFEVPFLPAKLFKEFELKSVS